MGEILAFPCDATARTADLRRGTTVEPVGPSYARGPALQSHAGHVEHQEHAPAAALTPARSRNGR